MSAWRRRSFVCAAAACAVALAAGAENVNLFDFYGTAVDSSMEGKGLDWTCDEKDVWELSEFSFSEGNQLRVECGPSQVVFGKHGTVVVWAVVFPDSPGTIAAAEKGQGEKVVSIWMRFNPAILTELFPPKTVEKNGSADKVLWAKRVYYGKINSCWQMGNMPLIPTRESIMVDVETVEGPRRFYSVDTASGKAAYEDYFADRGLRKPKPVSPEDAVKALYDVWSAFDREYAMFAIKPEVDWVDLRNTYRERVKDVSSDYEVAVVISEMLNHLEDLHVWVRVEDEYIPGYQRERPSNCNRKAVSVLLNESVDTGKDLIWGRTEDGIGYMNVYSLSNRELPSVFDEALESLSETWALILDLRFNGGGSETLALDLAGRFVDKERVYSTNRYRAGPRREGLGPVLLRRFDTRGPWRYESPVVALFGQGTMSSAESFALMLAQCPQVTTMGDRTAGSSANPRAVEAGCGITVNLPRWLDMDPDGKPIDKVGVSPAVKIETKPEDFEDKDPVFEAALKRLREQPTEERKPGKRQ